MKKMISIVLAGLLFLSSCGGTTNPSNDPSLSGNVITDPTTIEKVDWRIKYDPPVTVNVVNSEMPYVPFPKGDSASNNNWTRAYEEELGIKTNFLWVADAAQYTQKLNASIASGDLPDMFTVSAAQFKELVENDMLEDLSEVFLKYATDDVRAAIEEYGPYPLAGATVDGRLMGIPFGDNSKNWAPGMWIRTDWLEKLGLEVPKTVQELENVMIAFATKDPDGNGKADTFCGNFNKSLFTAYSQYSNSAVAMAYGAYPEAWYDKDGKIVYGAIQPEMKEALAAYKRLYEAGAINKEFATIDTSKANESVINDKVGIVFGGYYSAASALRNMVTSTKKTDIWKFYAIPKADGSGAMPAVYETISSYHVVRKGYEHPEVLIKLVNMFYQEFSMNGTDHDRFLKFVQNDSGTNPIWNAGLFQVYSPKQSLNDYQNIANALSGKDPDGMGKASYLGQGFYKGGLEFRDKKGSEDQWLTKWCWWVMACPEYESPAMKLTLEKYWDANNYVANLYNGLLPTEINDKYAFLEQKRAEEFFNFIIGKRSLDEWDSYVNEFYANGGKEVEVAINDWYKDHAGKNVFFTTWGK